MQRSIVTGLVLWLSASTAALAQQMSMAPMTPQMVVVALFQNHRILTQVAGDHMEFIKLLPPLNIGDTEVALFLDAFADVMKDAHRGSGLMWDFGRTLVKQAVTR